jgi:hypothetical protein
MWESVASGPWFFNNQHDKTIVQGTMEVGKNSVIYMGLIPGPNKTDEICGKSMVMGTMHWGSTVLHSECFLSKSLVYRLLLHKLSFNMPPK